MKDTRFAKLVLLVNGLVPGTLLAWDAYHGHAGANPVNYALRTTGLLALLFLTLSLTVTPLRKVTGWHWLFHLRRLLGLYAFFYALAHFSIFFLFDRDMSVQDTLSEMVKRPYLIVGTVGLLAMVPLAATSANFVIKRMGPDRWRALHRLAYVAIIAGGLHFYMLVKSDTRLPLTFGVVIALLLGYRVTAYVLRLAKSSSTLLAQRRWSGQLRVESIIRETHDVQTFRLVPIDGNALPFTYLPGQYLTLSLDIEGKTVRRSYTIASTPSRPGSCEVTIKREENGVVSRFMHDTIREGQLISVAAPSGKFVFSGGDATSVALLAAGVGITPLMSILRNLADQNWPGQIYLVYCNKTAQDIIFRDEILKLEQRLPNLHVTLALTRETANDWDGHVGRIDEALLSRAIPDIANTPCYLCGPKEMLTATRELLKTLGISDANIHTESFGSANPSTGALLADDTQFTVAFSRSNKVANINGRRSLLDLADELGLGVDSECRAGICGRCKCHLTSGSVHMESQDALDPEDLRNNTILLCQARALEDLTVEA